MEYPQNKKGEYIMKKTKMITRILSGLLVLMLIAALSVSMMACKEKGTNDTSSVESVNEETAKRVGEGKTEFAFRVTDKDGNSTDFIVCTDKTTVGDALLDVGLIEGEESEYGIFVKKVNGIVADFNADKTYWAFYIDGEYQMVGVDAVEIESGKIYEFRVSK